MSFPSMGSLPKNNWDQSAATIHLRIQQLFLEILKVTQNHVVPTKSQYTTSFAPSKSSKALNRKQLHPVQKQVASHDAIKLAIDQQLLVVIVFYRSVLNMDLALLKLLFYLSQFSSNQLNLQQLVSHVQFVIHLSDLETQIKLIIAPNHFFSNVCHIISTRSGFPILRGEARQRELATRI